MTANRISGLVVLLFAILALLLVIPANTETVGSGWLKPDTLPKAAASALGLLGIAQILRPRGRTEIPPTFLARIALVTLIACLSLWLMGRFGFVIGAIPAITALMVLGGERRIFLIGLTSLAVPAAIWLLVAELLGRPLP